MLVDNIIREHCRIRSWNLAALSVRSNHIHVVIRDPEVKPEPIVKQLKKWGTRKLREHRIIAPRQHAWADHASTIYLYEPGSLAKAVVYVLEMQDHRPEGHGREDWREKLGLESPERNLMSCDACRNWIWWRARVILGVRDWPRGTELGPELALRAPFRHQKLNSQSNTRGITPFSPAFFT